MRLPASPTTQACLSRAPTQTANTQSLLFLFFFIISLPVPIAIVLSAFVCYVLLFFKVAAVNQPSFPGAAKRKWLGSIYRGKMFFSRPNQEYRVLECISKSKRIMCLKFIAYFVICSQYIRMNKIGFILQLYNFFFLAR